MTKKHRQSNPAYVKTAPHRRQKTKKRNLTWVWVTLGIILVAVVGISFSDQRK